MTARKRYGVRPALLIPVILAALGAGPAACRAAARLRYRSGSSVPIVTVTSSAPGPRAIEARMAQFILALQANDRSTAGRLLSQRMDAAHRRAFLRGEWLTRGSTKDF